MSSGLSQYISPYKVLISVVRPAIVGAILWGLWAGLSRTRLDTNARVKLHLLALDHPNTFITTYPTVMTPAFAVPLSLILHGISLWQLRRRAR